MKKKVLRERRAKVTPVVEEVKPVEVKKKKASKKKEA